MIKASLDLHDPIDIYDHLRSQFGNLSMLIKDNTAILTFQHLSTKRAILQNPKRVIKGFPLTLKAFQEDQDKKAGKKINSLGEAFQNSMDIEDSSMELQNTPLNELLHYLDIKENFKKLKALYDAKLREIKQKFPDTDICNKKINEFNTIVTNNIKLKATFKNPFQQLMNLMKRHSLDPLADIIDIDTNFSMPEPKDKYPRKSLSHQMAPCFQQTIINYSSTDIGSVKRLCMLNEENFVTTLKLNEKGDEKGQLRIYKKGKQVSEFSLDIEEGPYSLMMHQNFILTGDFQGHIHMIDIHNENLCQFTNKLSYGLIVHMQKYESKMKIPSILTLLTGERNDYKIKLFEVEREKIFNNIDSLFFHPKEQILCQGMTMTLEVLNDGKFAYGCGKNTYICPSFNRYQRDYVTHDQNVMKIKMKNSQELIEATQRKILSLDLRACKIKNNIFDFKHDINNLQLLSEHYIFYGGKAGEVGVIDSRKPNVHVWSPPEIMHTGKISDILKMGDDIITGDGSGNIFGWKRKDIR